MFKEINSNVNDQGFEAIDPKFVNIANSLHDYFKKTDAKNKLQYRKQIVKKATFGLLVVGAVSALVYGIVLTR